MILTMNGAGFASNGTARLSKNKREIEIGPWQWGNISVSRRIYVDQAQGYCRWIDIFETNCGQDQQVNLRYQTNHASPLKEMVTSSGGKQFTPKKDYAWAAVLNDAARPVVVHVFCSRGAKEAPTPQCNVGAGDTYYNYPITVTNGKPVALCFFESQQPDADKARQFMKDFDPQAELGKVPPALRKIVLNIVAPKFTIEAIEMPRNEKFDMVIQADGTELLGTIANDKFALDSILGKVELPATKVIGLNVPAADDPYVQIVLTDGQVIGGKLGEPLKLKLENGSEQVFQPDKLNFRTALFRISPQRPQEIAAAGPMVVLRSGQRFNFAAADVACNFRSVYGEFKVDPAQVAAISTDASDGALHRVTFRNGSTVSGLIAMDKFTLKFENAPPLEVGLSRISHFDFRGAAADTANLSQACLKNEDEIFGKLLDDAIELQTDNGKITLKPTDIATIEFGDEALAHAEVKLRDNKTYSGTVLNRSLKFKIEPGPEISVPVSLLQLLNLTGQAIEPKSDKPTAGAAVPPPPNVPAPGRVIHFKGAAVMPAGAAIRIQQQPQRQAGN